MPTTFRYGERLEVSWLTPRSRIIPDYDFRLIELLYLNLKWFHKNDIVKILTTSPRSYCQLETMLFRAAPFEHYSDDDVEVLDRACSALFRATSS